MINWLIILHDSWPEGFAWPVKQLNYQPKLSTNIRDFIILFSVILTRESFKWLKPSREWLKYTICNMAPWLSLSLSCFLRVLFLVIRENEIFIFVIRVACDQAQLYHRSYVFFCRRSLEPDRRLWSVILYYSRSWTVPDCPPTQITTFINENRHAIKHKLSYERIRRGR